MREGVTFADVLIVPNYSDIESRDLIDARSNYLGLNRLPIVSAPMDYVTGFRMAKAMGVLGGYGIVNRFGADWYHPREDTYENFGLAIGTRDWAESSSLIRAHNPETICIDVAHGHHKNVIDTIKRVKDSFPTKKIMAGNVATAYGFGELAEIGVNAIRVGIGPGSACSTRENTGIGVPQLTAIMDCALNKEEFPRVALIADGGIQTPGDIAKALAAGADAVMLGRMLAGHDESPGEVLEIGNEKFKKYRGQSLLGSNGFRNAPEGVEGLVAYKGPVEYTINSLMNYLRSSMSYVGATNLTEFRERVEFIRVSPATLQESRTRI